ncbi:hypothetical protein GCM10009119_11720 [Algoriphagus jejuensis]|uniref:Uncharacterized protein n=1 Tax=Algoriphagus jejuensis TaxID=419934 RepID=A0ABP3YBW3_9BACT
MASCQSLTSSLIKVSGDFLDRYQDFRKEAAKVFVDVIIPGSGSSQKELNKLIDSALDLQTDLFKSYGVITGEGSGKIGARDLIIPTKKVTGTLIATERTFIVAPSPFDKVIVTIKKTDGKAGADICVCAKYATDKQEQFNKKEKSIQKGKDSDGDEARFVLADMAEKITTIHLVHKGFPTDKFEYTVQVEGEFSEEKMKELAGPTPVKHGSGAVRPTTKV